MLFDVGGNNVSRAEANTTVTLSMQPSPGFNSGRMAGITTVVGAYGHAAFANVSFDDAATLKRLTATSDNPWGASLVTASPAVVRVLPGPATFLVVRTEPRALYGVSPVSAQGAPPVSAEVQAAQQQIRVSVVLVDELGNDACTALMEPSECVLTTQGLAVGLTLVHDEWYNYTVSSPHSPTKLSSARNRTGSLVCDSSCVAARMPGERDRSHRAHGPQTDQLHERHVARGLRRSACVPLRG